MPQDVGVRVKVQLDKKALDRELLSHDGAVGRVVGAFGGVVTKEINGVFRSRAGGAWWPVESHRRNTVLTVTARRSRPHVIVASNAPALVFFWEKEGRIFKGTYVHHPGSSPPEKLILSGIEKARRQLVFIGAAAVK